ncbi:asparagine synthase-related protein [Rubrivivax gelatinosus]|uniref:asparagine synthase-related protein n=1 Tax=Rubrivivax gelatinosus TaxID=28068 RepID=UPI001405087B
MAATRGFAGAWRSAAPAAAAPGDDVHLGHEEGLAVAWHGELHALPALAAALGEPAGTAPARLLAQGWRRWGSGLLARLEGSFVLVLADADELLLYRDPSGLRNLFHAARDDGGIAFASWLPALLAPGAPALAPAGLHEYLRFLDLAAPATIATGVTALEPGQALHWRAGTKRSVTPVFDAPAVPADFEAAVDAVEAALDAAIATRLDGAARPAAFLSGGVDSALLCALAARRRPDLVTLTVGFDAPPYDEAPAAARIAARLGLRHEVLRFDLRAHASAVERLAAASDQPLADPSTPSTLLALEACRGRFDAVLDGTGADEALGLMPPRHVRLAVQWSARLPAAVRRRLAAWPALAGQAPLLDFEHPAETMIRWRGFRRAEIEALCGGPVDLSGTRFFRTFARYRPGEHFERCSALLDVMPSERLTQAMLASGQALRFPYAGTAADRLLRALPLDWRWRPGEPKRILRALLARHLPRELWDTPKHGFDFPLAALLAGEDGGLVRRHLAPGRWQHHGWLDPALVQRLAGRLLQGETGLAFRVWALVVLDAWLQARSETTETR